MDEERKIYLSLLGRRYGKKMSPIFSEDNKFQTWRKLWVTLAECQAELGLAGVTFEHVRSLKKYVNNINYAVAEEREKLLRHDVMAHVYAFGQQCPEAAGVLHVGATSCCITDNTELLQMYSGLDLLRRKTARTISLFGDFGMKYRDLPCLGLTHLQPAQPTTLGKRAAMWGYNFVMDYKQIESFQNNFRLRGLKGATGTQASFLELADGDEAKVVEMDRRFRQKLGIEPDFPITGQTYPRKFDSMALQVLAGLGESAHKFGSDVRILQGRKEFEEPIEKNQIGSSAMPYKRNPMKSERMCSLARVLFARELESRMTSSVQWLERTLDDSAARRDYIPQAFIAADEVLNLAMNIMENPVVYPKIIARNLGEEMPFMATENILMAAVRKGRSRQQVHEIIRRYSHEVGRRIKEEGARNNLLDLLAEDAQIGLSREEILEASDPAIFIGRAASQVKEFFEQYVLPIREIEKEAVDSLQSDVSV